MASFMPALQRAAVLRCLLSVTFVLLPAASSFAEPLLSKDLGQLGVPITWIDVPGSNDLFYMAQKTRDGRLCLTPNEAFFPKLGLTAAGNGTVTDIDNLNGGKSFATIEK